MPAIDNKRACYIQILYGVDHLMRVVVSGLTTRGLTLLLYRRRSAALESNVQ